MMGCNCGSEPTKTKPKFSLSRFLQSRKFVLALLLATVASVALGIGWLTGGEWVAAATIILGAYGVVNVIQPKLEGQGQGPADPTDRLED